MNVSGGAPNLINGISRQSPSVRLVSQLEESINQFPTITRGLVPRSPALHAGELPRIPDGNFVHMIDRDGGERYVVSASPQGIRVWTLEGVEKTVVHAPGSLSYLAGADKFSLQLMTVGDYTFVLNRTIGVRADVSTAPSVPKSALVYIVDGNYATEYAIRIDNTRVARFVTGKSSNSVEPSAAYAERGIRPAMVSNILAYGGTTGGLPWDNAMNGGTLYSSLNSMLPSAQWSYSRIDSVLYLTRKDGADFTVAVECDNPKDTRVFKGIAARYEDLPAKAPEGHVLQINGDAASGYDDYYVRYSTEAGAAGDGSWSECPAPGQQHSLDPATMPHVLVRMSDGSFEFRPEVWGSRPTGDSITNPWPSFLNRKIQGMVYAKNRLGFYHSESVAMSRHGKFREFFAESLLAPLDTDPVDVTIAHPEVSYIKHLLPAGEDLLAFTSSIPFRLTHGGDLFTQSTAEFQPLSANKSRSGSAPVAAGNKVFFADDAGGGARVFELAIGDGPNPWEPAEEATAHATGYLSPKIDQMVAAENHKVLFARHDASPTTLWLYRWKWIGNERVQAAWQKWEFGNIAEKIRAMRIVDDELCLVIDYGNSSYVVKISVHEAPKGGKQAFIDQQVLLTGGTYRPVFDLTEYTAPYRATSAIAFDPRETTFGQLPELFPPDPDAPRIVRVKGNLTGVSLLIGVPYESYGILSPLMHRSSNNQGQFGNALPGFDTWVASVFFLATETAYLETVVSRRYRDDYREVLEGTLVGSYKGTVGSLVVGDVKKSVSCMAQSEDLGIRFGSAGPYPYSINGLRWTGRATPVSY